MYMFLLIVFAIFRPVQTICTTVIPQYLYWNTINEAFVKCDYESVRWKLEVNTEDQTILYSSGWRQSDDKIVSLKIDSLASHNKFWVYLFLENSLNEKTSWLIPGKPNIKETFIQTNKPIYRPGETVELRILPIDKFGEIFEGTLQISILNEQNFALMQQENVPIGDTFIPSTFLLPSHIFNANRSESWKVRVAPQNSPSTSFFHSFEVAEYDLPNFELFFDCHFGLDIHSKHMVDSITIIAKYSYGKPVFGDGSVLCFKPGQVLDPIPESNQKLNNGAMVLKDVDVSSCVADGRILIVGRVRDTVTGHVEDIEHTINLDRPMLYLTILTPFLVPVWDQPLSPIKFVIGETRNSLNTPYAQVKVTCMTKNSMDVVQSRTIRINAHMIRSMEVHSNCQLVIINATHSLSNQSVATVIPRFPDVQGIRMVLPPVSKVGEIIGIKFDNAPTMFNTADTMMNYLIICNDEVTEFGEHPLFQTIHLTITDAMIPRCEIVMFSKKYLAFATLKVKSSCVQNTNIILSEQIAKPGDNVTVTVNSFPNGVFGLKASDSRLIHLGQKWNLEIAALKETFHWKWVVGHKLDQSVSVDGVFESIDSLIGPECMDAGRLWRQEFSECPQLSNSRSAVSTACITFFNAGCNEQKTPPTAPICDQRGRCTLEDMLRVGSIFTSSDTVSSQNDIHKSHSVDVTPQIELETTSILRKFFPETWLFEEANLDGSGQAALTRKIPDSMTNWTIEGTSWVAGKRRPCTSSPVSLTVVQNTFIEISMPKTVYIGEMVMVEVIAVDLKHKNEEYAICYKHTDGACTTYSPRDHSHGIKMYYSSFLNSHEDQPNVYSTLVPIEFWKLGVIDLHFNLVKKYESCTQAVLDRFQFKVEVKEKQSLREHFKTYILNPHKINPHHTQTYLEDQLLSYYEVDNADYTKVDAIINLNASRDASIKSFRVELRKFTPKWPILNKSLSNRPKRSVSSPFLNYLLQKLTTDFYMLKTAMHEKMDETLVEEMLSEVTTGFADLFSYNDCYKQDVNSKYPACKGFYSNTLFPTSGDQRSNWMTILSTLMHCEFGSDPSVICPSFHYVLNSVKHGKLNPDFEEPLQELSYADEQRLINSLAFLMYYQCADVIHYCHGAFSVEDIKDETNHKLLSDLFEHRKHPIVLAASAYVAAHASNLTLYPMQNILKDLIKNPANQPYWIYKPRKNIVSRLWSKFLGIFNSSAERRRQSNEILLNTLAFLSFNRDSTVALDLDPLYDWLQSQPNMHLMDTYFRHQALYRKLVGGGRKNKEAMGGRVTNVTIDCSLCNPESRLIAQEDVAVIYVPAATRKLKVKTTGQDKVQVGVRIILEDDTPSRSRRDSEPEASFDPSMPWPVDVHVNKSFHANIYTQRVCIKTDIPVLLKVLDIQHTPFTGFKFIPNSFLSSNTVGTHKIASMTQMGLFVTFFQLPLSEWSCYNVSQKQESSTGYNTYADVAIFVKHKTHGLVGKLYLAASSPSGNTVPIEKVCVNDHTCVCTESVCNGNMCRRCRLDVDVDMIQTIQKFLQYIQHVQHFALKVKILAKITYEKYTDLEFNIEKSYQNKINMTRMGTLRIAANTCLKCFASFEEGLQTVNNLFVIAGKIANVVMDPKLARSVYILQSTDYFEGLYSDCDTRWTAKVGRVFENT